MIEVSGLSRSFGPIRALEDVTFTVPRGEVVGLLGPNGAGKTTTMRILVGALGATAGEVRIDGTDVLADPVETRRRVGYLPEVPPLYDEMSVDGYLRFCAALKDAPADALAEPGLWTRLGLTDVRRRIIGNLSKGFRQRVGLAQALVHAPRVLVLDEPLAGLDPAQRIEIRGVMRELAAEGTTVLVSSHVLAEIEAVCDRVIVLSRGRVRGVETPEPAARRIEVVLEEPSEAAEAALRSLDHVVRVETLEASRYRIAATEDIRAATAARMVGFGLLELRQVGLEQRFLDLVADEPEETS
ncbi:MAG: ABC transporter ATP-binding protein [Myxococcota bacterium]